VDIASWPLRRSTRRTLSGTCAETWSVTGPLIGSAPPIGVTWASPVALKANAAGPPTAVTVEYTWPFRMAATTAAASAIASRLNATPGSAIENARNTDS
jgi:hypothetical protein